MDFKKIGRLLLMVSVMGLAASCTPDEPKDLEDAEPAPGRVKEITMMGLIKAVSVKYDNQNRVTKVSAPSFDVTFEINYKGNEITSMTGDDEDGRIEMTDVRLNSKGYIESFLSFEQGDPEPIKQTFSYDSEGHLTRISYSDGGSLNYTWENGLLTAVDEYDSMDPSHTAHVRYTYGDIENIHCQWSPFWYGTLGFYNLTGLFGKDPSKFIISATEDYETERYDYKLNKYGYISAERSLVDGETITLTYRY